MSINNADFPFVNFINLALNNGAFDKSNGFTKSLNNLSKSIKFTLSTTSNLKLIFLDIFCTTFSLSNSKYVLNDSCLEIKSFKCFSSFLMSTFPSNITPPGTLYITESFPAICVAKYILFCADETL